MRIVKFIASIFIVILLFGCEKAQPIPGNFPSLVGEYEWSYSTSGEIKDANTSQSRYGVKIDKKGYLYTFKDGKKLAKYKIESYWDSNTFKTYTKDNISIKGRLQNFGNGKKEIAISNFPNESDQFSNYFLDYD